MRSFLTDRIRQLLPASVLGFLTGSCIGVHGQTPEVETMAEAMNVEQKEGEEVPFQESLDGSERTGLVIVSLERRYQTLEGFGASVAWYHDKILGPTPEGLYEFLFPELGLDILRLRNRFERSDGKDGNLEQELEVFRRGSEALGYKPKILLTSWSPPASLKASGKEKCAGGQDCTLKKENGTFIYEKFADWWIRSLKHYQEIGLAPTYVSMQNEPDFIPPDWEGCKFEATESESFPGYGKALAAFHARLGEINPRPLLLGPETLGVHYNKVQNYLAGLDVSMLDGVAHHLYESGNDGVWDWRFPGPDSYVDEMLGVAEVTGKPIYQTEFQTDEDKGIDGGFETAWLIHHTLVEEGVVSFLYWDLIWDGASGLVGMSGRTPKPRDQYYSLRHFARYTDPGYQRVGADAEGEGLLASAYVAPDESQLTLVILNTSRGVIEAEVAASTFGPAKSTEVYRTSYRPGHSKRWEELGALENTKLRLPAHSVATVVLHR